MPKKSFRFLPLVIFFCVLLVYFFVNPHPSNLFQHFVYIADSFLRGHLDIVNLPWHYGDIITVNGKTYFQYAPAPSIVLLPLVYLWKTGLSQTYVSMVFGSLNAVLVFILLGRLKVTSLAKKLLLTSFFAFGTVHFSAAVTGTTWFFDHIIAVFFLLLALVENFGKKRLFLMGLFFSFAVFSRQTTFLSLPFFLLFLKKDVSFFKFLQKALLFTIGCLPLFVFDAYYNFARFGSIFDDGRYYMYLNYINSFSPYTFVRLKDPHFVTGMMDIRNIPLGLYTLFAMLPDILPKAPFVRPSPYGLSVIITSPLFFYAFLAKRNFTTLVSWLTVVLVALAGLLWFAQGWVQFGYRYLLDFIPFLMILVAYGIKDFSRFKILLLIWCVIVNTWGAYYLRV